MFIYWGRMTLIAMEFITYWNLIICLSTLGRIFRKISQSNNLDLNLLYRNKLFFPIFNKIISQRKHIELIYNNISLCVFILVIKCWYLTEISGARFIKSLFLFFKGQFWKRAILNFMRRNLLQLSQDVISVMQC